MKAVSTYRGGQVKSNFQTLGAVDHVEFTVPRGRKWKFQFGRAERDVNANFRFDIYDADGNWVWSSPTLAAGVTAVHIPNDLFTNEQGVFAFGIELGEGWIIRYEWGAAQGTPEVTCVVLEW